MNACHVAVGDARLDDVLPLTSQELASEDFFEWGRLDFKGRAQDLAIHQIAAGKPDRPIGGHQTLRVERVAQRKLRTNRPSVPIQWQ